MKRRILSIITALALCLSLCPTWALAAEADPSLCKHHPEHTEDCGYTAPTEGHDCGHEHTAECYTLGVLPDADSGDPYQVGGDTENLLDCHHSHNSECGYVQADPGTPCGYVCRICPIEDLIAALPEQVTEDNAADVRGQLDHILDLFTALNEGEQEEIDLSRIYALQGALDAANAPMTADGSTEQQATDEASVTINGETLYYATLKEAFAAANGKTATITMLTDAECVHSGSNGAPLNINSGTVTLNLNGKTLSGKGSGYYGIINVSGGSLLVQGEEGKVNVTMTGLSCRGSGKLTVEGITLELVGDNIGVANAGVENWGGTVVLNGTQITGAAADGQIYHYSGTTTINNVTATGTTENHPKSVWYENEGTLTINGGTFDKIVVDSGNSGGVQSVAELLGEGYTYKKQDGAWATADEMAGLEISNVTVEKIPLTINPNGDTSWYYSTQQTHTLAMSAAPVSGGTVTYVWKNGEETLDCTSDAYTVPAGMPVGSYTYTCEATCDDYTLSHTFTFKIEKSGTDLADGKIKTYNGETETTSFTAGDTITVKATPTATGDAPQKAAARLQGDPDAGQMAVYVNDTQVSAPVGAVDGTYTMTVSASDVLLAAGGPGTEITLTAKFVGNDNMADGAGTVDVNISAAAKAEKGGAVIGYYGESNLASAFAADSGNAGATFTLLSDVEPSTYLTIQIDCTLDLNGHTIHSTSAIGLSIFGSVTATIQDQSQNHRGQVISDQYQALAVNGSVTLEGGTFTSNGGDSAGIYVNSAGASLSVTGEKVVIRNTSGGYGLAVNYAQSVQLSAGTYEGEKAIEVFGGGKTLAGLLNQEGASRVAYYKDNTTLVTEGLDGQTLPGGSYTVKVCTHTGEGVCTYTHNENTSTHTKTCLACGYTETGDCGFEKIADPTADSHTGQCPDCKRDRSGAHSFSDWAGNPVARTCTVCGYEQTAVAKVEKDSTTTYVGALANAFTEGNSGATVTLLSEVDLGSNYIGIRGSSTFTLDLNGQTVRASHYGAFDISGGSLTIQDSGSGGKIESSNITIEVTGGTLSIKSGTVSGFYGVQITSGTVNISGGVISGTENGLWVNGGGNIVLSGGAYSGRHAIWVDANVSVTLKDLLASECAYHSGDTPIPLQPNGKELTGTVTVKECNHTGGLVPSENGYQHGGPCKCCGTELTAANHTLGADNQCSGCGAALAAKVEKSGSDTIYVEASGLADAFTNDGVTVTLLSDVALSQAITLSGSQFTLSGGGHTITYTGDGDAIQIASGTVTLSDCKINGKLCGVRVNGGTVQLSGCAITAAGDGYTGGQGVYISDGDVTISGGTYSGTGGYAACGVEIQGGKLTIESGTFSGADGDRACGVNVGQNGKATIRDGSFSGTDGYDASGLRVLADEAVISGGVFTGSYYGVYNTGTTTISGGTFTGGTNPLYSSASLAGMLATGCAYYRDDKPIEVDNGLSPGTVRVQACDHTGVEVKDLGNGKHGLTCPYCGYHSEHTTTLTATASGSAVTLSEGCATCEYKKELGTVGFTFENLVYGNPDAKVTFTNIPANYILMCQDNQRDDGMTEVSWTLAELFSSTKVTAGEHKMKVSFVNAANIYSNECELPFTVAKAPLMAVIDATNGSVTKPYDGTTAAPEGLAITLTGLVEGDDVTASASFAYNSENVADANTITATDITLGGADAGNYRLTSDSASIEGTITKADQAAPAAPAATEENIKDTSITLTIIANAEYSKDGTNWQASPTFTGLDPNRAYTFYARLKEDGNHNASPSSTASITTRKMMLDNATVTVGGSYTYTGAAQTPAVAVVKNGKTLTAGTDYTVSYANNTNAGTATVTITGMGDYEGTNSTTFTVQRKTLTVAGAIAAGRPYNGTNTVTITGVTLDGIVGSDAVSVDTADLTGTLNGSNVGSYTAVTLPALTLTGGGADNYTLTQPSGAVSTSVTISKADAPTAKGGAMTVSNDLERTYSYSLDQLLPVLTGGQTFGTVTYSLGTVSLLGDYYTANAAVTGDKLSLPINEVVTNDEKVIGTVEITISSTNFKDMKATITISSVEKIVPEGTPTASPNTITYGQSISAVTLSGQMSDGTDRVDGRFTWDNPNATPDAGTYQAAWTFIPTDTGRYTTTTGTVTITVRKATPSLTLTPSPATLPNGGTVTLTLSGLPDRGSATVTCSDANITVTKGSGNTWTADLPAGGASYTFTASYSGDGNHNGATANCTVSVEKITPTLSLTANPTSLHGGGTVTLTLSGLPAGGTATVTCSGGITVTAGAGNTWTATLPNNTATYTFTASYAGNASYNAASASCTVEAIEVTVLPNPPAAEDGKQYQVVMEDGISEVPAGLQSIETLNTPEKLETAMKTAITQANSGVPQDNTAVYDVELQISDNGGATWTKATAANFPANGLTVTLPYPAGTNSGYTFTVVHMFTTSDFGKTPGHTETPTVTNTADGLRFTVTGLSPISVGWVQPSTPTTPTGPTGGGGGGGGWSSSTYAVTVERAEHGKVTSNRTNASSGSTVTLTVTPDTGYVLDTLTVTDSRGSEIKLTAQGGGKYTFTMPGRVVTVKAAFAPLPDDTEKPCDGGVDCPSHGFTDLGTVGTWYHEAVDYVLRNNLMGGYGNGLFGPNDTLTRAQFAQILYNKEGRPAVTGGGIFTDVAPSAWCAPAITWAAERGIVGGYGNGAFGPNDNITREQLAVMLWRYAGSPAATEKELHFTDADKASGYALEALRWAVENGVMSGKGGGILDPKGLATRAQTAQMLKNLLGK